MDPKYFTGRSQEDHKVSALVTRWIGNHLPSWRRLDRTRFGEETQEFSFGALFKMQVRHPKVDVKKAVRYKS